ncbi:MAG: hypothetical protein U9Q92_07625 [archaeon]|nr:hypothetical protein [archaeon]
MEKKGFEKSINVVITIVVLLVVALALITLVLNNITDTDRNIKPTTDDAACNIWKKTACGPGDSGTKTHPNIANCDIECNF